MAAVLALVNLTFHRNTVKLGQASAAVSRFENVDPADGKTVATLWLLVRRPTAETSSELTPLRR